VGLILGSPRISGMTEARVCTCSMGGAFDAAFAILLWPLVNHFYQVFSNYLQKFAFTWHSVNLCGSQRSLI